MTYRKSIEVIRARMSFNQQIFNEIYNIPENSNFSREVFYIIGCFGLKLLAKEEGLITNDNKVIIESSKEDFIQKLKKFIFKHIK